MSSSPRPRLLVPAALFVTASWLFAAWLHGRLPARVPVHWNAAGEADGWGSRALGAFLVPVIVTTIALLFAFLPRLDPRLARRAAQAGGGDRADAFARVWTLLTLCILGFLLAVQGVVGAQQLDPALRLGRALPLLLGLLFAGLGALMPRFEPNWLAGIRTPWTLEDDRVWHDTHRFGGRLFVGSGLLATVAAALAPLPWAIGALMAAVGVAAVGSVVYSWRRWKQLHPVG